MDDGIFTIQVRKCKRCGRLLTSKEAVERGYGCQLWLWLTARLLLTRDMAVGRELLDVCISQSTL